MPIFNSIILFCNKKLRAFVVVVSEYTYLSNGACYGKPYMIKRN